MTKPGHWRIALDQLTQATTQILSAPEADTHAARMALDQLHMLYQWSSVMQAHELHRLNEAVMQLTSFQVHRLDE